MMMKNALDPICLSQLKALSHCVMANIMTIERLNFLLHRMTLKQLTFFIALQINRGK